MPQGCWSSGATGIVEYPKEWESYPGHCRALAAPVFAGWWADHHSSSYSFPLWVFMIVMV